MKHLQIALLLTTTFSLTLAACGDDDNFIPPGAQDASVDASGDASEGPALSISSSTVSLTEAAGAQHSDTVTVSIPAALSEDTELSITFSEAGKVSASSATIAAGETSAEVSFTASEDEDAADEVITATIEAEGYEAVTVRVEVEDDEVVTPSLSANLSSLALTEAAGAQHSGSVRISLSSVQTTTVALTVTMDPEGKLSAPANPSIPAGNAAVYLNFTAADDADTSDETVTVTISADGFEPVELTVTITDDDTPAAPALSASPNTLSLTEGGAAGTVTLSVPAAVSADTPLSFTYSEAGKVSVAAASIASGASSVELRISPVDDDDTEDESVTITVAAAGYTSTSVTVSVDDDDTPPALSANPATITLTEAAGADHSADVTISVAEAVGADTALTVSYSEAGKVSTGAATIASGASSAVLSFTAEDDADTEDETITVTVSATGYTDASFTVNVTDDDTAATPALNVTQSGSPISAAIAVTEAAGAGHSATVTVSTPENVSGATALTVTMDPAGALSASASPSIASGASSTDIVFTAVDDANTVDELVTVTIAADGYTQAQFQIQLTDDDDPAIVLDTTGGHTAPPATALETAGSVSFWLTLNAPADPAVSVTLSSDNSDVTLSPSTISLDGTTAIEVTATITADGDNAPDLVSITAAAAGYTSYVYSLAITEASTSAQAFVTSADYLEVTEGGEAATFMVRLTAAPSDNVSATVGIDAIAGAPVTVDPASLSFTAENWDTPQQVSVSADDDADALGTHNIYPSNPVTLHVSATGVSTADVDVDVNDDESQISIGAMSGSVSEGGGTATFDVTARSTATSPVAVVLSAVEQAAQPITLSAPSGTLSDGDRTLSFSLDAGASLTITVTGGSSATAADGTVNIAVTAASVAEGNQAVSFVASTGSLSLAVSDWPQDTLLLQEGGPGQELCFTRGETAGAATVELEDAGALSLSAVSFADGEAQACGTLSAGADADVVADAALDDVTFNLMVSGSETANASLNVQVRDSGLDDETEDLLAGTPYGPLLWNPYNGIYGMVVDANSGVIFRTNNVSGGDASNTALYFGNESVALADVAGSVCAAWEPAAVDTAAVLMSYDPDYDPTDASVDAVPTIAGLYTSSGAAGAPVDAVPPAMAADGRYLYAALDGADRHLYLSGTTAVDLGAQAAATDLALVKVGDNYTALWTNGSGALSCMQITGGTTAGTVVSLSTVGTVHEYAAVAVGDGLAVVSQAADDGAYNLQTLSADCSGLQAASAVGPAANGDSVRAYNNGSEYLLLFQVGADLAAYRQPTAGGAGSTLTITGASRGAAVWAQDRWGVRYLNGATSHVMLRTGSIQEDSVL